MKKTTVKYLYEVSVSYPLVSISKYRCLSCKVSFLDADADYQYCPYCGKKIKRTVN
nr:MAG TPA: DNA-directed RNA polymerase II subunit [Caudoviricetes sp.]